MSKNMNMTRNAQVVVPLTVPSGTVAGQVLFFGTTGLMGYTLTDRQPALNVLSEDSYVHGLAEGQASVELSGVSLVVVLTVPQAVVEGDAIYVVNATPNTYSSSLTGGTLIGWAIAASGASAGTRVALKAS